MQEIIERYKRHTKDKVQPENQVGEQNLQVMPWIYASSLD